MIPKNKKTLLSLFAASVIIAGAVAFYYRDYIRVYAGDFLPTDFDHNGIVDNADVATILQHYSGGAIIMPSPYDLNGDFKVDAMDLAVVEDNVGNGTDPNRNFDQDGWSVAHGDCNDRDKSIFPLAKETENSIDDNCNGRVDELSEYEPLVSSSLYEIKFAFSGGDTSNPSLQFDSVTLMAATRPSVGSRGFGSWLIAAVDSSGKTTDARYFDIPSRAIVEYSNSDQPIAIENKIPSGTFSIQFPKSDKYSRLVLRNLKDSTYQLEIPLDGARVSTRSSQEASDVCPPELGGDGAEQFYGVLHCINFQQSPELASAVVQVYSDLRHSLPQVIFLPIISITFADNIPECGNGGQGWEGCYVPGRDQLFLNPSMIAKLPMNATKDLHGVKSAIAHELGHHFQFSIQAARALTDAEIADYEVDYLAELVSFLSRENCADGKYCSTNFADFNEEWDVRNWDRCDFLICGEYGFVIAWDKPYAIDPVTNSVAHISPRPNIPGTVSAYAATSTEEEFADLVASLYESKANPTDNAGYKHIIDDNSTHQPPLPFAGLTTRAALLGKYGLINDRDRDGIPDEYDNCDPMRFSKCVDNPAYCANSDQRDLEPHDGIGDQCNFHSIAVYCSKDRSCLDGYGQPRRDANGNLACPGLHKVYIDPTDPCAGYYGADGVSGPPGSACTKIPPGPTQDYPGQCAVGTRITQLPGVCGDMHGQSIFLGRLCGFHDGGYSGNTPAGGCNSNDDCAYNLRGDVYLGATCSPEPTECYSRSF